LISSEQTSAKEKWQLILLKATRKKRNETSRTKAFHLIKFVSFRLICTESKESMPN